VIRTVRATAVLLISILLAACTTTVPTTTAALDLGSGERVAFVFSQHAWLNDESKKTISRCLADGLRRAHSGVDIISEETFMRMAFPDLDARGAPREAEHLALLLEHPTFIERIAPLRLRYLVSVSGEDELQAGLGVLGTVGAVATFLEKTSLSAVVVDVSGRRSIERATSSADSLRVIGVVGIVPIVWWGSASDNVACARLSEQLRTLLETEQETSR